MLPEMAFRECQSLLLLRSQCKSSIEIVLVWVCFHCYFQVSNIPTTSPKIRMTIIVILLLLELPIYNDIQNHKYIMH